MACGGCHCGRMGAETKKMGGRMDRTWREIRREGYLTEILLEGRRVCLSRMWVADEGPRLVLFLK